MPYCENKSCRGQMKPEEVHEDARTGELICPTCAEARPIVKTPPTSTFLDRPFSYGVTFDQQGLRGFAKLGGARVSFEVDQEELTRTFGPPQTKQ